MAILEVTENKKQYLPLLLLGDEQEDMIDRYLERGRLFVMQFEEPIAVCVVTNGGGWSAGNKKFSGSSRLSAAGHWTNHD